MPILAPQITQRYSLGPVKSWVEAAAYYLGPKYGIKSIGGWRATDPFPDHPSGHALDFMCDIPTGNALANDAIAHSKELGVKYIIHNGQVWNPQQGWQRYTSTSNPHTDHVHITFNDNPGTGFIGGVLSVAGAAVMFNSTSGGVQTVAAQTASVPATCAWSFTAPSVTAGGGKALGIIPLPAITFGGQPLCILTKTQLRAALGVSMILGGASLVIIGAILLVAYGMKDTAPGQAIVAAGKVAAL